MVGDDGDVLPFYMIFSVNPLSHKFNAFVITSDYGTIIA
jgi:hypothetical protein